jgi:hypothetical protein
MQKETAPEGGFIIGKQSPGSGVQCSEDNGTGGVGRMRIERLHQWLAGRQIEGLGNLPDWVGLVLPNGFTHDVLLVCDGAA